MRTIQDLKTELSLEVETSTRCWEQEKSFNEEGKKARERANTLRGLIAVHPEHMVQKLITALQAGGAMVEQTAVGYAREPYHTQKTEHTIVTVRIPGQL